MVETLASTSEMPSKPSSLGVLEQRLLGQPLLVLRELVSPPLENPRYLAGPGAARWIADPLDLAGQWLLMACP